jgi:hypothetical protein
MKKILVFLFAVGIAITSCKTKAPVKFGLMGCYKLSDGEEETIVTKEYLKLYDNELRVAETQSFINKLTKSTNDKKYFGFVLADVTDTIISKVKRDSSITILDEKKVDANETTYHFFKIKKTSGLRVVKVLFKQPKLANSIMLDAVFESKDEWEKFYAESNSFLKKFECENEKE